MIDVETALRTERTIDIVTIGRRTGLKRVTEIWFTNIDGRIIICGTASADGHPGRREPRDWLANLKAHPAFQFCFKGALEFCLPAKAVPVVDPSDRRQIMSAPATKWYREQGDGLDDLVAGAPIVDVFFLDPYHHLNAYRD